MENILEHRHYVFDSDPHFSIDPITRAITNQSKEKTKLIQYDHNSERFTFEIPRYVEGHDMSLSNRVEIHYINISGSSTDKNEDVYICEDKQLNEENGDKVVFSWLISRNATIYAGKLNFLVKFICSEEDKITYAWNTAIFTDITIANGMNNGEPIVEEYSDILQQWYDKLVSLNVVDNELSLESENPVQNKVITEELEKKQDKLTAGNNITIENGVISAQGGGNDNTLKGNGAPTTETIGEIGQDYIDTTTGTSYQCTSIIDGVYTWVKLIKETDIAQNNGDYGLVKLGSTGYGFVVRADGTLACNTPSTTVMDGQNQAYQPITTSTIAYAIKQGLINPNLSPYFSAKWTDEERAKAMATLGKTAFIHEFVFIYEIETHAVYVVMDTVEKKGFDTFKNIRIDIALNIWGVKNIYESEGIFRTDFYKSHYTNERGESVYDIGIKTENDDYLIDENNFTLVSEKII